MNAAISDILSGLEALETEQDFQKKFEETFSDLGYNKFTYVGLDADIVKDTSTQPDLNDVIYLTNSDPNWVQRYVEKDYSSSDPIVLDCLETLLPIRWTETYRANSRSARESEMMADAWEHGLRRGLTVPVHGPGGELGILSLYSDLSDSDFLRVTDCTQNELHLFAHHAHSAIQSKLRQEEIIPLPTPLTNREVEILQWTVEGKTAWEIGSILNIKERTVNFHIQNVMEKFGVHNKTQAAARAIGMGVLDI
jgi:LuxR family quorum-sensing transcriptional regulator LasR